MSASHHPTDIHLRQHRAKKRNKLRASQMFKTWEGLRGRSSGEGAGPSERRLVHVHL